MPTDTCHANTCPSVPEHEHQDQQHSSHLFFDYWLPAMITIWSSFCIAVDWSHYTNSAFYDTWAPLAYAPGTFAIKSLVAAAHSRDQLFAPQPATDRATFTAPAIGPAQTTDSDQSPDSSDASYGSASMPQLQSYGPRKPSSEKSLAVPTLQGATNS